MTAGLTTVEIAAEGDFDGLVAIVDGTWRPAGDSGRVDIRLEGFIVEGALPPNPEPWSAR